MCIHCKIIRNRKTKQADSLVVHMGATLRVVCFRRQGSAQKYGWGLDGTLVLGKRKEDLGERTSQVAEVVHQPARSESFIVILSY